MTRVRLLALIAPAIVLALSACSGDDDEPAVPTSNATPQPAGSLAHSFFLTAREGAFNVSSFESVVGAKATVQLRNEDTAPHQLAIYADQAFTTKLGSTGRVENGKEERFEVTFPSSPGTLGFRCEIHPSTMKGTISLK